MKQINIIVPSSWQSLTYKQLRFVFTLLASEYITLSQVKALCLFKWAKMKVLRREGAAFIVKCQAETFPLTAQQVAEAITNMSWLDGFPTTPVRLAKIGRYRPASADFRDIPFGDFLALENLFQGFLQTQKGELLGRMAEIMYHAPSIRLRPFEEICIFYWFASVKEMFARTFTHFFKSLSPSDQPVIAPSFAQLQESMNTQIRALTGGDITKEKEVLAMDCWRALTELDAKAKDYEELKKSTRP